MNSGEDRDEHEASELHVQLASSDAPLIRLAELDPLPRLAPPRHELGNSQLASLRHERAEATRELTRCMLISVIIPLR
jgi:hypothetical protein